MHTRAKEIVSQGVGNASSEIVVLLAKQIEIREMQQERAAHSPFEKSMRRTRIGLEFDVSVKADFLWKIKYGHCRFR